MATGAPLPTRAAIAVHWLQALLFGAATVSFAMGLRSRVSHGQSLLDGTTWSGLVFCAAFAAALLALPVAP